jgi:hypothetical protein
MDWKLEVVVLPVGEVDASRTFEPDQLPLQRRGRCVGDADDAEHPDPAGLGMFGDVRTGLSSMTPGSVRRSAYAATRERVATERS